MNEFDGRTQSQMSRWATALSAAVGFVVAVSATIVVSGWTVVGPATVMISVGLDVLGGPVAQAAGGLRGRRGWLPAVLARARGPPGARGWWPVPYAPCPQVHVSKAVREVRRAGRGRCGTGCRLEASEPSSDGTTSPQPGAAPVVRPCPPSNQESSDEITVEQFTRSGRRSDADGDSRDDAHGRAMEPVAADSRWHTHRLTSSSRANDLKR